jgi:deoxyribonuclease V
MDGHGMAHPRRMGIATQFGITVDAPTMGCAKNILTGEFEPLAQTKGSFQYIIDKDEKIGMVYRSRDHVKPIFISPGHKVSFEDIRTMIAQCLARYKLPETTRQAHRTVNKLRKREWKPGYWENNSIMPQGSLRIR